MTMSLKQRKIKFEPRIKLNHNRYFTGNQGSCPWPNPPLMRALCRGEGGTQQSFKVGVKVNLSEILRGLKKG